MPMIAGASAPTAGGLDVLGVGQAPGGPGSAGDPSSAIVAIRAVMKAVGDLEAQFPMLGQEAQQMRAILRQAVMKAAQGAPTQNASASSLPAGQE